MISIRKKQEVRSAHLDIDSIRSWVEDMSHSDLSECGEQVQELLQQIIHLSLNNEKRFLLLNEIQPTVRTITTNLITASVQGLLCEFPKNKKLAQDLKKIYQCCALAYGMVADDINYTTQTSQTTIVTALYAALDSLAVLVRDLYSIYAPIPSGVWRQIHQLYGLAVKNGIDTYVLSGVNHHATSKVNIEDRYKSLLLFSLANPYQFSSQDHFTLENAIANWINYATLEKIALNTSGSYSMIKVCLNEDKPPTARIDVAQSVGPFIFLNTDKLIARLKFSLRYAADNNDPSALQWLQPESVIHLLSAWAVQTEMRFGENRQRQCIPVSVGLGVVGSFGLIFNAKTQESKCDALKVSRYYESSQLFIQKTAALPHLKGSGEQDVSSLERNSSSIVAQGKSRLMDKSDNGFCLLYEVDRRSNIVVGQLITVNYVMSNMPFIASCVVRWKKHVDQFLLLGLEIITKYADPAIALNAIEEQPTEQPVLILPQNNQEQNFKRLIAAADFECGCEYALLSADGEEKVKLTGVPLKKDTFKIVEYEKLS